MLLQSIIEGRFWITKKNHNFLGHGRMDLLIHIEKEGSITKAAKSMQMSYKAAWDAIDSMNNLSQFPLVVSSKGGKGGGKTALTPYAKELIKTYKILQEEHKKFLENLSNRISEKNGHIDLLKSMDVRISARNQLKAKVYKIQKGILECEIFLILPSGDIIMTVITNDSLQTLGITDGSDIYAFFKANSLVVCKDPSIIKSDMNRFIGNVVRIESDNFGAQVTIETKGLNRICSSMSLEALKELNIKIGSSVSAFCKPKNIILGIW